MNELCMMYDTSGQQVEAFDTVFTTFDIFGGTLWNISHLVFHTIVIPYIDNKEW